MKALCTSIYHPWQFETKLQREETTYFLQWTKLCNRVQPRVDITMNQTPLVHKVVLNHLSDTMAEILIR